MGLNASDFLVIAAYLVAVTLFGLRFRTKERSLRGYFLAANRIPWWAISISIVAAETSTLTIISLPGLAYSQDFRILQLAIGYVIGRVAIASLLIPHYFRGELVTAYELIARRFGERLRWMTAGLFLLTRAAAEGVRVFAVAIVVRLALGSALSGMSDLGRDVAAIGIVTLLTLLYTFEGGMAAVIWTDVVQLSLYVAGALLSVVAIAHTVPGGWTHITAVAANAGRFHFFDSSLNLTTNYTVWSGVIGGAFLITASHGTDQLIVQRLLAARSERQSKLAIVVSGLAVFLIFALFLLIGAMLFVFYQDFPPAAAFTRPDTIFPTFIATRMPHVLAGLMISAILAAAMSNLSAALNSLSSTSIVDFYARFFPQSSEERRIKLARAATVCWAVVLFLLALLARRGGTVIEMGLSIASVAYGSLLGVFLLGVLTRSASERGAMMGMSCGIAFNVYCWLFTRISFTWYVVFGSAVTFSIGYAASRLPGWRRTPQSNAGTQ
jgi:solute:Na+ symporter, SSS family